MAVTDRGRRTRYDNIAAGSALTTKENLILDNTVSRFEAHGGGFYTSTSTGEMQFTNIDASGTSVSNTAPGPENMTAGVDPTDENVG